MQEPRKARPCADPTHDPPGTGNGHLGAGNGSPLRGPPPSSPGSAPGRPARPARFLGRWIGGGSSGLRSPALRPARRLPAGHPVRWSSDWWRWDRFWRSTDARRSIRDGAATVGAGFPPALPLTAPAPRTSRWREATHAGTAPHHDDKGDEKSLPQAMRPLLRHGPGNASREPHPAGPARSRSAGHLPPARFLTREVHRPVEDVIDIEAGTDFVVVGHRRSYRPAFPASSAGTRTASGGSLPMG